MNEIVSYNQPQYVVLENTAIEVVAVAKQGPSGGGTGVHSVNGLVGALTLVAGANVTIDTGANEITISATGSGGGAVDSVNGQTGAVVLDTDDIDEGATNLYFTEGRVSANVDVAANTAARHAAVTLAGVPDYITIVGQVITRALINLASHVTGRLPFANLTQGSALSVLGVTGNAAADNASIAAASDHQVFRRNGTAVGFGAINLASANAVSGLLPPGNTTPIQVDIFSSSSTWNKPTGAKRVIVIAVGAGGGGGSGRRHATTSNRCGGGGGSAGRVTICEYSAAQLGATETVTIGAAGVGAPGVTADNTNGTAGTAGGDTFFGGTTAANSKQMATGGSGGSQGTANPNPAPVGTSEFTLTQQFFPANTGGTGTGAGSTGGRASVGPSAGGSGGGLDTSNVETAGGNGGAARNAFFSSDNTGGKTGGAPGGGNGTNGTAGDAYGSGAFIYGEGASGGGSAAAANAGNGGNGANPGGGGGGGGASSNGFTSGDGGDGGDGILIAISVF